VADVIKGSLQPEAGVREFILRLAIEDKDVFALLPMIYDEGVGTAGGLALPVQCIPDEFVFVGRLVNCLLLGDEKPDFTPVFKGKHAVPQRCICDREKLLQLHPGIDMTDLKRRPGRTPDRWPAGYGPFFAVWGILLSVRGFCVEEAWCIVVPTLTDPLSYGRLAHRCLDQLQECLGARGKERIEVSRTKWPWFDGMAAQYFI
jgi:hypothetical protein